MKEFLEERVYSKRKSLNDRVPHNKRKNFSTQELKEGDGENLKGKTDVMDCEAMASAKEYFDGSRCQSRMSS